MSVFILAAAVLAAAMLLVLLRPLLFRRDTSAAGSHRQLNTRILRDQLARIDQDVAEGALSEADAVQARAELKRRALQDTQAEDDVAQVRAPRRTAIAIALSVPLAACALYLVLGNPASIAPGRPDAVNDKAQVEAMVAGLAKKLEADPSNFKGWVMLARSYKVMGRNAEAERAFERAGAFIDDDAVMLANYADVVATNAGGQLAGKPTELIDKALKADPDNGMALWLGGTAAMQRKDYVKALAMWQRLAPQLAPGSEDARNLEGAIAEVRGLAGPAGAAAVAQGSTVVRTLAAPAAQAAAGGATVSGTVTLDAQLKSRVGAGDTLMVIARAPGTRMPLAVLRVPARTFPLQFTLDDSLAMSPQAAISGASDVEVEARISKTGQARAEPGDLISAVQVVKVGAKGVAISVAQVRP